MSCKPKPDARPYRRKPKDVTAFAWDGEEVEGFERVPVSVDANGFIQFVLAVNQIVALAYARPGDWIVTIDGVDAVMSPDDFARDYDPAPPE